jgi:chromosome segregation and condensation protein ScpB
LATDPNKYHITEKYLEYSKITSLKDDELPESSHHVGYLKDSK